MKKITIYGVLTLSFMIGISAWNSAPLYAQTSEISDWLKNGNEAFKTGHYKQAVKWYLKAAKQGNDIAEKNIGVLYDKGRGVSQDYQEAMEWYLKAAKQGNDVAEKNIGVLYDKGRGVSQDYQEAMEWYLKAAEHGNDVAEKNIGDLYDKGQGVPQDYQEAMKWYQKAAEQGNADAEYKIGDLNENGQGAPQDYQEAMKWYQKAAAQGKVDAEFNIGVLYDEGLGVSQDYKKAMKWYEKAAVQGDVDAEFNIGALYENGQGVPQDYQEAMKWYQKAAVQGDAQAEDNIGFLYEHGQGVPQDYQEAMKWYQKAAAQGDAQAEDNIGDLYDHGLGVPKDNQESMKWHQKAAAQGKNAFLKPESSNSKKVGFYIMGFGGGQLAMPFEDMENHAATMLTNVFGLNYPLSTHGLTDDVPNTAMTFSGDFAGYEYGVELGYAITDGFGFGFRGRSSFYNMTGSWGINSMPFDVNGYEDLIDISYSVTSDLSVSSKEIGIWFGHKKSPNDPKPGNDYVRDFYIFLGPATADLKWSQELSFTSNALGTTYQLLNTQCDATSNGIAAEIGFNLDQAIIHETFYFDIDYSLFYSGFQEFTIKSGTSDLQIGQALKYNNNDTLLYNGDTVNLSFINMGVRCGLNFIF